MVCVYCNHSTSVTNSRPSVKTNTTWRRRKCSHCGSIFTTRENIDYESILRVQKTGRLEPFYRDKLLLSVHRSLSHRKKAYTDAGSLTDTITVSLLSQSTRGLLSLEEVTDATLSVLKRFDKAAAVHYRANHS